MRWWIRGNKFTNDKHERKIHLSNTFAHFAFRCVCFANLRYFREISTRLSLKYLIHIFINTLHFFTFAQEIAPFWLHYATSCVYLILYRIVKIFNVVTNQNFRLTICQRKIDSYLQLVISQTKNGMPTLSIFILLVDFFYGSIHVILE